MKVGHSLLNNINENSTEFGVGNFIINIIRILPVCYESGKKSFKL